MIDIKRGRAAGGSGEIQFIAFSHAIKAGIVCRFNPERLSRAATHIQEVAVLRVFIGEALIVVIRQIHAESARDPVCGKVSDLYLMGAAFQIDCAARELQRGDSAVCCHFPGGSSVYRNICGCVRSGHGRFAGPDASSIKRNISRATLIAETAVPECLIEICRQLSRESFQRLGVVFFIHFHAIEHVTIQDRLVTEGKIHDSFVVHGVIRCTRQRGVSAGVGCVQCVIPFGFQISQLLCVVA